VGLVLAFTAGVRGRLLSFPLERDEGEYAYMGQLLRQDIPPYEQAYNMKFPGTYLAYGLIMSVFGETTEGVHLGLLLVNALTIVLIFQLGRRLMDDLAGVVAAVSYGLLSLSPQVLGFAAHATHFVVLPAIAGLLLLWRAVATQRKCELFAGGLCFGVSLLMKQHGALLGGFAVLYLLWVEWRQKNLALKNTGLRAGSLALGILAPFLLACVWLTLEGVLPSFVYWTFAYAREYATSVPLAEAAANFKRMLGVVTHRNLPFWFLAGAGLVLLLWKNPFPGRRAFLLGILGFSFLEICPGFYFRHHYFIVLLPALGLLAGAAISGARQWLERAGARPFWLGIPSAILVLAAGLNIFWQRGFMFAWTPVQAARFCYGENPFPESVEVARYIEANCPPAARIAVIGSEPQIYFYSHRRAATGFLYTYPLVEKQKFAHAMQQQMIQEIEAAAPEFLVYVKVPGSWIVRPDSEKMIFDWAPEYCVRHYQLAGLVEIFPDGHTDYRWNEAAANYRPQSPFVLFIFKRKPAA